MKKTILVLLMALVFATPCLAKEIETDEIFSLAGTEWRCIGVGVQIPPVKRTFIHLYDETVDFSERSIFTTSGNIGILQWVDTYLDFLVFSVAWDRDGQKHSTTHLFAVMQPAAGVGMFLSIEKSHRDQKGTILDIHTLVRCFNWYYD